MVLAIREEIDRAYAGRSDARPEVVKTTCTGYASAWLGEFSSTAATSCRWYGWGSRCLITYSADSQKFGRTGMVWCTLISVSRDGM